MTAEHPWNASTVAEEFDVQLGKRLDGAVNRGDPKKCINNRGVRWGRVLVGEAVEAPLTPSDIRDLRLVAGDVLVCEGGEIGRASVWSSELPEAYFLNTLHRLRTKGRVQPHLLVALFQRWATTGELSAIVGKATLAHLTKENLLRIPLPVPPAGEQDRIVEAIDDIDGLIAILERLIAKKQAIKQGMMEQLLIGKTHIPGFTSGDWKVRPLREGVSLISGTHVMARDCNTRGIGTPYLTGPADFPAGKIKLTKYTTRPTVLCKAGDILVTVKGSGSGSMIEADAEYCISRQLMAIRSSEWDPRFLFYSLLHNASRISAASTGLIPGLSRFDILDQQLPIPSSVAEQSAIAETLSTIDRQIEELKRSHAKKVSIKMGLMQQLLTGRTRLPIAEATA